MKKEDFLIRATVLHGDKYIYDKVTDEFLISSKQEIFCTIHKEYFSQIVKVHLRGCGCNKCAREFTGNKNRLTTEEFIKRAKDIHGDLYDYSKVEYNGGITTKVLIGCPVKEHGFFLQTPRNHLSGNGCNLCGRKVSADKQKSNTEDFILKAKAIHKDTFDYSLVDYSNNHDKVSVICLVEDHGVFSISPTHHLSGKGCPKCRPYLISVSKRMSPTEFLEKAKEVHGDRYSYIDEYMDGHTKIKILCNKHNKVFTQRPYSHLQGQGCPICGRESVINTITKDVSDFIISAKKIHGDKYDYNHVEYVNSKVGVTIICDKHGAFTQTPNNHLRGAGCRLCRSSGYSLAKTGYFYILKVTENVIKFGITTDIIPRLRSLNSKSCYDIQLLYLFEFKDGGIPPRIESEVKRSLPVKGVVAKADMADGYSETTYTSYISTILSIVENFTNNPSNL